MSCHLCHKDKVLSNSHIVPEFLYKSMYDEKHRFHVISAAKDQKDSVEQKGLGEKLLCADCEITISRWEDYACRALTGGVELTYEREGRVVTVNGLNYAKLKLFQLSVLWRAGVSSLEMFSRVNLGPHEPILRQMLLEENPGHATQYGCVVFGLTDDEGRAATSLIVQPERVRMGVHVGYRFVFGGFAWFFLVSSTRPTEAFSMAFLTKAGKLVFTTKNIFDAKFMKNFAETRARNGKAVD